MRSPSRTGRGSAWRLTHAGLLGAELTSWWRWPAAFGITALCTAVAYPLYSRIDPVNLVMLYLLGVTMAGLWLGMGPAVVCAIANDAAFDYCFVRPKYSFYVADPQDLITLLVMMVVALVIANLMAAVRRQTEATAARERRTATLYAMSRELAATADAAAIAAVATPHVAAAVEGEAVVVLAPGSAPACSRKDAAVVDWVLKNGLPAGPGTAQPERSACLHLPLPGGERINGVLVVRPGDGRALAPGPRAMLDALAGQIALALERARLAELAAESRAAAERAALRNTLLASISHDLRAPLTVIAGAGCLVAQQSDGIDSGRRRTLGHLIEAKARDMSQLLENVLELMRLESAAAPPRADWQSMEELVGAALRQTLHCLGHLKVRCEIPDDLPLLYVDGQLIRQLIANLLENAAKHTPPGTIVEIRATPIKEWVLLTIEDDGPGFGGVDPERLFEKFERGQREGHVAGAGLGLTICRAVARLHGGSIRAMNRAGGGARLELRLPQTTPGGARPGGGEA